MKYNTDTGTSNSVTTRTILQSVQGNATVAPTPVHVVPNAKPSSENDATNMNTSKIKKTKVATTKAKPSNGSHPKDNEALQQVAIDTLHTILLNDGNQNTGTGTNDDDDDMNNIATANTTKIRHFLNLFGAACSNRHLPTHLQPNLSMKDQQQLIYTALQRNHSAVATSSKMKEIFQSLHRMIQYVIFNITNYTMSSSLTDDQMDTDSGDTVTLLSESNNTQQQRMEGYLFLHFATLCVTKFFEGIVARNQHQSIKHSNSILLQVFHIAETLHDFLDFIDNDTGEEANITFQTIITLCEQWWICNGYEKESIIRNTLPTMLGNVVGVTDPKSNDIKRLYHLRTALSIIDYDDVESQSFVSLLLRITSAPACIRHPDGKKLIIYLLSDPEFQNSTVQSKIHLSIRAQIPNNQPSIVLHYSDIYYMAWKEVGNTGSDKDADISSRNTFEMDILSDYIYASIYAEQPSLVPLIHILLSKWYNHHPNHNSNQNNNSTSSHGEDRIQFLYRMYTPILWRATVAPNPVVRTNAVQTLLYVFPLSSSDNNNNNTINKVCTTIQQLLQDPDIKVRCTTAQMTTQLLLLYWDGIPTRYIHMILNCIVSEHASDVTSSAVRVGAVNAMTQLLDTPQSHGVLREILPAVGNLIHDKVEKVRLAVVQLLLKIKGIPNIKYYHIVPLEHLTARFIEEAKVRHPSKSIVAAALTSLMVNSYFPENSNTTSTKATMTESSSNQDTNRNAEPIRRALQFCTDEPEAAIVFYTHVSKYRSFSSIVQLVIKLFRCLYDTTTASVSKSKTSGQRSNTSFVAAAMKRRRQSSKSKTSQDDASSSNDTASVGTEPPIEVLATIAEVICTLWGSIATKLQQNDEWNAFVTDECSESKLNSIFIFYDDMAHAISEAASSSDDDLDVHTLLMQEDCYRICSAIVSCAGRLPSPSVKSLASSIIKSIQHEAQFNMPQNRHIRISTDYIYALMCNWDMTDQFVAFFTSSIRSSLYKIVTNDSNPSFIGSPMAVSANSKKRRSGRSIVASKSRNVADDGDILASLQLPTAMIVNVLNALLLGSDPNHSLARDAILSSTKASDELERLFYDGVKCMERIIDQIESRSTPFAEFSTLTELVSICDLYGRFVLHKEAYKSNDDGIALNDDAKNFLFFTSNTVVPALQRRLNPPFIDPNISSIQMDRSFANTMMSSPQSPNPMWRSRRRSNRNQTPQRLDREVDKFHNSPNDSGNSDSNLQEAVIGPLFVNSCRLFTEWLKVSSCSNTAQFIMQAATEWCPKISSIHKGDEALLDLHEAVIQTFLRMVGQLLLTPGSCAMLKEILNTMGDETRNIDNLQNVLSTILTPKASKQFLDELVDCFLDVTYDSLLLESETASFELPDSIQDDWTLPKRSLYGLLVAIMSHQQACNNLASKLIERFMTDVQETSFVKLHALFYLQCMWLLISDATFCKISADLIDSIVTTVQHVDVSEIHDDSLKMLLEDFQSRVK